MDGGLTMSEGISIVKCLYYDTAEETVVCLSRRDGSNFITGEAKQAVRNWAKSGLMSDRVAEQIADEVCRTGRYDDGEDYEIFTEDGILF